MAVSLKTYTSLWAMQPHDQTGDILSYDARYDTASASITSA